MVRMPENGPLIEGGLLFLSAHTEVGLLIERATIRRWASDQGNTVSDTHLGFNGPWCTHVFKQCASTNLTLVHTTLTIP